MRIATRALVLLLVASLAGVTTEPARADDAKDVVDQMIKAHGGLKAWSTAPTVAFTDTWTMPDGAQRTSKVIIEQGRRRSTLEVVGSSARLAWDGEKVWSSDWSLQTPPRFMAQLNYYFLNLPWLTQDAAVHLQHEGTEPVRGSDKDYHHVRMTFAPGAGDTPDDYYVLYIDTESYQLHGCEYVVTYKPILPEGIDSTPPNHLIFESFETVDGLVVPTAFTIYNGDDVYAKCDVTDWDFELAFDASSVEMPEDAVVDTSMDGQ